MLENLRWKWMWMWWKSDSEKVIIKAYFSMVARTTLNGPYKLPPLVTNTLEEKKRSEEAKERKDMLLKKYKEVKPDDFDQEQVDKIFSKYHNNHHSCVNMKDTSLDSYIVLHPQKRNIHNQIFGGYIMRLSFEQAWTTAYLFTANIPLMEIIDEQTFLYPVAIGDIAHIKSTITFSDQEHLHIEVTTEALDPTASKKIVTNTARYVFRAKSDKRVVPNTKEERKKFFEAYKLQGELLQKKYGISI